MTERSAGIPLQESFSLQELSTLLGIDFDAIYGLYRQGDIDFIYSQSEPRVLRKTIEDMLMAYWITTGTTPFAHCENQPETDRRSYQIPTTLLRRMEDRDLLSQILLSRFEDASGSSDA